MTKQNWTNLKKLEQFLLFKVNLIRDIYTFLKKQTYSYFFASRASELTRCELETANPSLLNCTGIYQLFTYTTLALKRKHLIVEPRGKLCQARKVYL